MQTKAKTINAEFPKTANVIGITSKTIGKIKVKERRNRIITKESIVYLAAEPKIERLVTQKEWVKAKDHLRQSKKLGKKKITLAGSEG